MGIPKQPRLPGDEEDSNSRRWWTVPNFVTLFRWVGSLALIYLGWIQWSQAFVIWYFALVFTDWIDGRIAVLFHQRSALGARLDSFADATLYAAVLVGGLFLWHARLLDYWHWLALAIGSYALATGYGFAKFGRWPSYHTWTAKGSWVFVLAAIVCLAWDQPLWPLPVAMVAVTVANLESLAITFRLPHWQADVRNVFSAPVPPNHRAEKV